jgi:ribosome biogenesis protein ERB1
MRKIEDPYFWRTVKDKMTGENVILTDADADAITRIKKGYYPDANYNPYPDFIDFFTYEKMIHPVTNRPEHKASFIPSTSERKMISRLVAKIKRKWQNPKLDSAVKKEEPFDFSHDLWIKDADPESRRQAARRRRYIPAPKLRPPDHRESYNPPPEFCASEQEVARWKAKDPAKRHFLPQQFPNLRSVPAYAPFVKERFDRCLDLYLCPRVRRMKADVNPEDLIPKLPRPKELQPFPSQLAIIFKGHEDVVKSISLEPFGQFVASGSSDKTVKIWEVLTGRCFKTFTFQDPVSFVAWNPNPAKSVVAVATGKQIVLLNPGVGSKTVISDTDEFFLSGMKGDGKSGDVSRWKKIPKESGMNKDWMEGKRIIIQHNKPISQIAWHIKGDYFAIVMPDAGNRSVIIHQLSKERSQIPFSKSNGIIRCVLFHPTRPYFVIATQKTVRVYNLMKQELSKKLLPGCNMISSIAIHPGGDNIIVGTFDNRLPWFDLDLSDKPYKTMRYHKRGIRAVDFHAKYPLFASAGDEGTIVVSHGMVYNDLAQNALIVPVKILKGHAVVDAVGITDCKFHPQHPWIISSGSDKTIRLFS